MCIRDRYFNIINNAPGTASPIPGLLAPFGFNDPKKVLIAVTFAVIGGTIGGLVGSVVFKGFARKDYKLDEIPVNEINEVNDDINSISGKIADDTNDDITDALIAKSKAF